MLKEPIHHELAFHKHLFGTIYAWAGQVGTYTTGCGLVPFWKVGLILPSPTKHVDTMRADLDLGSKYASRFSGRAAEHFGEINAPSWRSSPAKPAIRSTSPAYHRLIGTPLL